MDSKPRYVYDKENDKLLYDVPYSDKGSLVLEVREAPDGVEIGEKQKKVKQKNNKSEIQKLKEKVKKLNDKLADAQIENQRLEKYIEYCSDSENIEILKLKEFIMSKGLWGNFIKNLDMIDKKIINDTDCNANERCETLFDFCCYLLDTINKTDLTVKNRNELNEKIEEIDKKLNNKKLSAIDDIPPRWGGELHSYSGYHGDFVINCYKNGKVVYKIDYRGFETTLKSQIQKYNYVKYYDKNSYNYHEICVPLDSFDNVEIIKCSEEG